jgi:hypothetical protein
MILRRVIQHVRNQEWTAIAIDLVIVVVGVYMGIQAQAWNVERENRQIERQYLLSLHDEISEMIESNNSRVAAHRDGLQALNSVAKMFAGTGVELDLAMRHCIAITNSHIYVARIFVPPTIEELKSTGRLQLISNNALRSTFVSYSQTLEGYRQLNTDIQSDRQILARAHPSLITLDPQDDDIADCKYEAMGQSPTFLNDLADNIYRYEAYVDDVVIGQQELRVSLHTSLDRELGISHSDDVSE